MTYQTILISTLEILKKQKETASKITLVRLFLALLVLFILYLIVKNDSTPILVLGCVFSIGAFLFFVNFHQKLLKKIKYNETIIHVCEDEIKAEKGINNQFNAGNEYINREHSFTFDLDIFGEKSVFQYLNRTFTKSGKDTLASQLQNPFLEKNIILARQEAIQELKNKPNWRVNFLATGNLLNENNEKFQAIKSWLLMDKLAYFQSLKFITWTATFVNILLILLCSFGIISIKILGIILLLEVGFNVYNQRNIDKSYLETGRYTAQLAWYVPLFKLIEDETFEATFLKNSLAKPTPISEEIQKLITIGKYADLSKTQFGAILNTLFLWDYHCSYRFEVWKKQHHQALLQAFETLHEFEVLVSIASYAYANSAYVVPIISDEKVLESIALGHPLLNKKTSICNDFSVQNQEQLFIVTGANMAGKSTFLRAIGTNLVLAMIGSPVYAKEFSCKPIQLFTCMRITDSVGDGESYFHAELDRLRKIVRIVEQQKPILVILDELLKGTNSKDKLAGSELFLEKLLTHKNVFGMIATHDLALTEMVTKYPKTLKNICFEIVIKDDRMTFDYKLKNGVTQNMNALFLMKQMEII